MRCARDGAPSDANWASTGTATRIQSAVNFDTCNIKEFSREFVGGPIYRGARQ